MKNKGSLEKLVKISNLLCSQFYVWNITQFYVWTPSGKLAGLLFRRSCPNLEEKPVGKVIDYV